MNIRKKNTFKNENDEKNMLEELLKIGVNIYLT